MSNTMFALLTIIVMAVVTYGIRIIPFLLFGRGTNPPRWVSTLGNLLPPAIMSVLVIYCVRNVDVMSGSHGIPELVGIVIAMALHAWKRNTLLSICVSTIIYMILVQLVFV